MRPVNFEACILTFSSQDENSYTTYRIEGITFNENDKDLFIVTELLFEEMTYSKDGSGHDKRVKVGTVLLLNHSIKKEVIEMDTKKYKYWTQYLKIR